MTSAKLRNDLSWDVHPDADKLLDGLLSEYLAETPEAERFRKRLLDDCSIRLRDIVDHLTFTDGSLPHLIEAAGWVRTGDIWRHEGGHFPAFVRRDGPRQCWFRVESVAQFVAVHPRAGPIEGMEHGPARRAVAFASSDCQFGAFERAGYDGFDIVDSDPAKIRAARIHSQKMQSRRRQFDGVEQGLDATEAIVAAAVADLGQDWACDLWLRSERAFWMLRCHSGRYQKALQDAVGVGWSNIDHHTYDSSRGHFLQTLRILRTLGYQLREMLYAGELAGWGSQVLEQPTLRSTIFADVDLTPDEIGVDFAHDLLPELPTHRRAGLLSVLHGESILEAGLNHVAGLYDRRRLQAQLGRDGIALMSPFSDFGHLYQQLTHGDWSAVNPDRVDQLEQEGHIPADEAEAIRLNGAILSHLENIERNHGYKGFNREGIDSVLRKLDPRAYVAAEVGGALQ